MPLPKTRVGLLNPAHLIGRERDLLGAGTFFEAQQTLVPIADLVLDEHLLNRRRAQRYASQAQLVAQAHAAPHRVGKRQVDQLLDNLRRRRERMVTHDRRHVLEAVESVRLKPPLPLVEARAIEAASPASLRDVPQPSGELQYGEPLTRQLLGGILGRHASDVLDHRVPSSFSSTA